MLFKWLPWRFVVRNIAKRQGFIDPIKVLSQLQNFMQPSEVTAPTELLRLGVILHARGLMNSLAVQHNMDWVWPYWIECQYNPHNKAFIPRSFSLTQINLTHRNWTAVGIPNSEHFPIVDPRGLFTPFFDGWSLDAWIIPSDGEPLIPSRLPDIHQVLNLSSGLDVTTQAEFEGMSLKTTAMVLGKSDSALCHWNVSGHSAKPARLIISLRPYNPEGVSFVHDILSHKDKKGWLINGKQNVYFDRVPDQQFMSYYQHGDVFSLLNSDPGSDEKHCKVGMATGAAVYHLTPGQDLNVQVEIPLSEDQITDRFNPALINQAKKDWDQSLSGSCQMTIPDAKFQFLYEAAVKTIVLHSPLDVYPGPFVYRRFWFRDAALILKAMLCVGLDQRARIVLDRFRDRQNAQGYFLSQEGEWDSNGEALWIMQQYCAMTNTLPPKEWKNSIYKGGKWIYKKCVPLTDKTHHAGLLPSGFSAEHLGPNDFYYWDDFWGVAGLNAAADLCQRYNDPQNQRMFLEKSQQLFASIDRSLDHVVKRLQRPAIPASPHRRMDSGAIGSLAANYPLTLWDPHDPRMTDAVNFLMENCLVHEGFFHDMTHSGINPYLTLYLAQVLLRANDPRYFRLIQAVADIASPTGQWPEAVHPITLGGCMGDGQHVWAAAEWIMIMRNCFVREERGRLILCAGLPLEWLKVPGTMRFGQAPTEFGPIDITITSSGSKVTIDWVAQWFKDQPVIEVFIQGRPVMTVEGTVHSVSVDLN